MSIPGEKRKQVSFRMAIEKVKLMHEHFPKYLHMGTVGMKDDKETGEEAKQKRVIIKKK